MTTLAPPYGLPRPLLRLVIQRYRLTPTGRKVGDLPDGANRLNRGNKFAHNRKAQSWRALARWEANAAYKGSEPLAQATVLVIRYGVRVPDTDNMTRAAKPLIDGLTSALVIAADTPKVLRVRYWWMPCKAIEQRTELWIWDGWQVNVPADSPALAMEVNT